MSGRQPLVAGNWKMNLTHLEAIALVQKVAFSLAATDGPEVEVVVLPPFTALRSVQTLIEGDKLPLAFGAQDLSAHDAGAYTGEVSGPMLAKLGCRYVVVGHSERRAHHGEDDELVRDKVRAAHRNGIVPILCVGEPLEVRRAGGHAQHTVRQLRAALDGLAGSPDTLVVAYEPVWAIGTGETATPADAQEVCAALRDALTDAYGGGVADGVRILYGGSVKADTVDAILGEPDVDGALVGGASLVPEEFVRIVRFRPVG